ncbi:10248_t:CDS:2 [Diversispora eburnea]|uniref:10248_t:CDS:1 n=1 Tax=Diversispora eburnea TaxID=1213867 RepID=A0A9N9BEM9_9GLOM|nr:10248_t:CDS:2 [Diversispora eburnea]
MKYKRFLDESKEELLELKINHYIKNLEYIVKHEKGNRTEQAQIFLDKYKEENSGSESDTEPININQGEEEIRNLTQNQVNYLNMKKHKIDELIKIINSIQKNQTIVLIEFSYGRQAPLSKINGDGIKLYRNSIRVLNKLLKKTSKNIA